MNPAPHAAPPAALPWCVADTQVVPDWLVFADAAARPTLDALSGGRLRWLATPSMRVELVHMLRHPTLARWGHDAARALAFFDRHAGLQTDLPTAQPGGLRCRDPDDQPFIDAALARLSQLGPDFFAKLLI